MRRNLLLVGCGHAHLFVLEALAAGRLAGYRVTLVSPDDEYYYSGMIPGVLAGMYRPEQARFRPPLLARAAGARWVVGRVERIDAGHRRVHLADGTVLGYDVLSLDVGSRLAGDDLPGVREHAIPVKPMRRALAVVERIETAAARSTPGRPPRVVVVGGGAAGVEIGLCLDARLSRSPAGSRPRIAIVEGGDEILPEHPPSSRRRLQRLLAQRQVEVRTGVRVEAVRPGALRAGGAEHAFEVLVWATGPRAPALFRRSGLPTDERGYLLVDATLRSVARPEVFGVGDCSVLEGHPRVPRAGVYAVRQGSVLVRSLDRIARGEPAEPYRPQRAWLSLLNTGDGRAVVVYRGRSTRGRAGWWLKDRIDRRFMERFQSLEARTAPAGAAP